MGRHLGRSRSLASGMGAALVASLLAAAVVPPRAQGADTGCPTAAAGFAGGDGTPGAPHQIATPAQLQLVKTDSSVWADAFVLTADIPLAGCTWDAGIGTSANPFSGSFDGAGFAITDLTVALTGDFTGDQVGGAVGVFGVVSGATVRDLHVAATVSASISGAQAWAGGIVGSAVGATLTDLTFAGSVSATSTSSHPSAGGIIGQARDTLLARVGATASVTATPRGRTNAGGIAGVLREDGVSPITARLEDAWSTGVVTADGDAQSTAGGLVGLTAASVEIARSVSDARVIAAAADEPAAGGLVGYSTATITDSSSRSVVTSAKLAGGLIGWAAQSANDPGTVERSYFAGTVSETWGFDAAGGIVGGATVPSGDPFNATATFWDVDVAAVTQGVWRYTGGFSAPVALSSPGAVSRTTSQMRDITTFTGWDIAAGYSAGRVWGICPSYNDGYPYLTALVSSDPCAGVPAASLSPGTQTVSGDGGATIATPALATAGFVNAPLFTVSPALPTGLTLNQMTGEITGTVQVPSVGTAYTITATSQAPRQVATSVVTQSRTPSAPSQLTFFTSGDPDNGAYADVATRPTDGFSLAVSFYYLPGNLVGSLQTFLIDSSGAVVGAGNEILDAGVRVIANTQPAVAYNPVTGGWLVCYAQSVANRLTRPLCQYLDAAGAPSGPAFAIAPDINDENNQAAITYNPTTQRFFVVTTTYSNGPVARFIDAAGTGVVGAPVVLADHVSTELEQVGGVDAAASETSDSYSVVIRAGRPTESYAAWVYHLGSDGIPDREPTRLLEDTSAETTNGSVAWNRATNAFMVVAVATATRGLVAQPFSAVDGSRTGTGAETAMPGGFTNSRWRPSIASHTETAEMLVAMPLTYSSTSTRVVMTLSLDSTGAAQAPVPYGGNVGNSAGPRPRIAFNPFTCSFFSIYQWATPGWLSQLAGAAIPSQGGCRPTAPRDLRATAGDGQATLSWQVPLTSGSSTISGYAVRFRAVGGQWGSQQSTGSTATRYVLTGLTNGTQFEVQVAALSADGQGPWSSAQAVTPDAPPAPPVPTIRINITAKRGDGANAGRISVRGRAPELIGKRVAIRLRFPGDSAYSTVARVPVDADGRFHWSRLANRKAYVFAERLDVRSAMVTIPARVG